MTAMEAVSALFAAVLERAAAQAQASLDDLAAGFGSASGLLAHVLNSSAHQQPSQATADSHAWHEGPDHAGGAYGVLFADAAALTTEPELTEPARGAYRAIAAHLAGLIQRAQADGDANPDTDLQAAAWLLLSVLSARRIRAAAMPPGLEPAVTALALQALAPPPAAIRGRGQTPPDTPGPGAAGPVLPLFA
jgi:hypothetical protein